VLVLVALAGAIGFAWGLPGGDSWAADSISPRSCGLGAIVETYWTGHYHDRPPLHMAILTIVSLPWIALAVARAGTDLGQLADELIKPLPMTGIEVTARLVTLVMAIAIVNNTMRLWGRLAGRPTAILAGLTVATNAIFVYYAHTGNVDIPSLFWVTWCLVEIDRVAAGEAREGRALLLAVAAVLTKDQTAGMLIVVLPLYLVLVPWFSRGTAPLRPGLVRALLLAIGAFAIVSGALVNPLGFTRRLAYLLGPASQSWAGYPRSLAGIAALVGDAVRATPHFTSWPIAAAAGAGVVMAIALSWRDRHLRLLLPFVAAASFFLLFNLGALRSEDRFLLPEAVLVLPYAGLLLARLWAVIAARGAVALVTAVGFALALGGVASVDGTLLVDSRYAAEAFLAHLAPGTHVEVYGGPIFLPRIPSNLVAARPGIEPVAERQRISGVRELVDPVLDPRSRSPDIIVLATELSNVEVTNPPAAARPSGLMQYRDAQSHALFRGLYDGTLGYDRVFVATCALPWPLECRTIHDSTGGDVWIYASRRS
jgi:hypothetical protein